jgi:AraC family transcriptional regulator
VRGLIRSLDAHRYLKAAMTACSWDAGWCSLLLRAYDDPPEVEEITTPPTPDHLVVLVTGGSCNIEGRYRGRWRRAHYRAGSLGMTAPGEEVTLRWRGETQHQTLQLHLPAAVVTEALDELSRQYSRQPQMPNKLLSEGDPVIQHTMLTLADAMAAGAPDLYAETAAAFLTAHLLVRHGDGEVRQTPSGADARLRRADDLMRQHLGAPLSLVRMAQEAGISQFHFLRLFKQTYGETPSRRLTRLRMEEAQRRLKRGREPITEIASCCGYDNPAHFASAFRRFAGVAPSAYRKNHRD